MMHATNLLLSISLIVLLAGCGDRTKTVSSPELAKEIRNREVRHITPAQITQAAFENGQKVTNYLQAEITRKLTEAMSKEGLVEAAQYCKLDQIPATDSLQKQHLVQIKRIRLKGSSAALKLNDLERQLLEAYQYSAEQNQPIDPNVQKAEAFMLFTSPISLNSQTCLKCHGQVGKDLSQKDFETLSAKYKIEHLVNQQQGQTIAIWSLIFDKKELVKQIE